MTIVQTTSPEAQDAEKSADLTLALAAHNLGRSVSEVARDAWATDTDIDPTITHTHRMSHGRYAIVLSHVITDVDHGTDVIVKWADVGPHGGVTPEEFAIAVEEIPGLIAALQAASAHVNGEVTK